MLEKQLALVLYVRKVVYDLLFSCPDMYCTFFLYIRTIERCFPKRRVAPINHRRKLSSTVYTPLRNKLLCQLFRALR